MLKKTLRIGTRIESFFYRKSSSGLLIRKTSLALVVRVLSVLTWFLLQGILIRELGRSLYGDYIHVLAWTIALAEISTMGLDKVLLRYVAEYQERMQGDLIREIVWHSFLRVVAVAITLSCMLLALALGVLHYSGESIWKSLPYATFLIPVLSLTLLVESVLRALNYVALGLSSALFTPLMMCCVLLLLPIEEFLPKHVLVIQAGSAVLSLSLLVCVCVWQLSLQGNTNSAKEEGTEWASMKSPMLLMTIQNVIQGQSAILLCGAFLESSEVGVYGLLLRIAALLGFGLQTINMVVAPMFAKAYANSNMSHLQSLAHTSAWVSALFSGLGGLVIVTCGDVIHYLFDMNLSTNKDCLLVLLLGAMANALAGSVGYLLLMSGNHSICVKVMFLGALLNLGLATCLIPLFGVLGAAVAHAVSTCAWNAALVYVVYARMGVWSLPGRLSFAWG